MPGLIGPVPDERTGLLAFLAQQRDLIRIAVHGLDDEAAAATPSASAFNLGGLVKHVANVEEYWMDLVAGTARHDQSSYADNLRMHPGETLADILALYADVATRTEEMVAAIDDLGTAVPVPPGTPWFPAGVEAWSVRWVLLHLIEETARHAGHADIIRESLDGATAIPLMAAVEGWPESPWVTPWRPAARAGT